MNDTKCEIWIDWMRVIACILVQRIPKVGKWIVG